MMPVPQMLCSKFIISFIDRQDSI